MFYIYFNKLQSSVVNFGLAGEYGELSFNDFLLDRVILKQYASSNQN